MKPVNFRTASLRALDWFIATRVGNQEMAAVIADRKLPGATLPSPSSRWSDGGWLLDFLVKQPNFAASWDKSGVHSVSVIVDNLLPSHGEGATLLEAAARCYAGVLADEQGNFLVPNKLA